MELKSIVRRLAIVAGLDARRRREGMLPPAAELALAEAENLLSSVSGGKLLAAWRTWRDSGSHALDPFAEDHIVRNEFSPGAKVVRRFVRPVQSFPDGGSERVSREEFAGDADRAAYLRAQAAGRFSIHRDRRDG